MEKVTDWFEEFYRKHRERHQRPDWPDYDLNDEFIRSWIANFTQLRVEPDEAEYASVQLTREEIRFLGNYLPALVNSIESLRQSRINQRAQHRNRTREEAAANSYDCPECEGSGRAIRKYRIPDRYDMSFDGSLFCRCDLGRFDERQYSEEWPEERAKRDDLQAHPDIWSRYLTHRSWSSTPSRNPQDFARMPFNSYWVPPEEGEVE